MKKHNQQTANLNTLFCENFSLDRPRSRNSRARVIKEEDDDVNEALFEQTTNVCTKIFKGSFAVSFSALRLSRVHSIIIIIISVAWVLHAQYFYPHRIRSLFPHFHTPFYESIYSVCSFLRCCEYSLLMVLSPIDSIQQTHTYTDFLLLFLLRV